jgi:hypothetical protein
MTGAVSGGLASYPIRIRLLTAFVILCGVKNYGENTSPRLFRAGPWVEKIYEIYYFFVENESPCGTEPYTRGG